jgi:hypothetical protein
MVGVVLDGHILLIEFMLDKCPCRPLFEAELDLCIPTNVRNSQKQLIILTAVRIRAK